MPNTIPDRPDWLVVPLVSPGSILVGLGSACEAAGFHLERPWENLLELRRGEVRIWIERVDSPFPSHRAPSHLSLSAGRLFDGALIDCDLAGALSSEGHTQAGLRIATLQMFGDVLAIIERRGASEELILPLAHAETLSLQTVVSSLRGASTQDPAPYLSAFTVLRRDASHAWLDGPAIFSAPNVGVSEPQLGPAAAAWLGDWLRRLLEYRAPATTFEFGGVRFGVERLRPPGFVWLAAESAAPPNVLGRYQFASRGMAQSRVQGAWWSTESQPPEHAAHTRAPLCIDLITIHSSPPLEVAVTNGLGASPLGIELAVICPLMGPPLVHALSRLATSIQSPVGDWDLLAFSQPTPHGIGGAIAKPLGEVAFAGFDVRVLDALPLLDAELDAFRGDPAAQDRWIDERFARVDYAALHRRWERFLPSSFAELESRAVAAMERGDLSEGAALIERLFREARSADEEGTAWFWRGALEELEGEPVRAEESLLMSLSLRRKVYGDRHGLIATTIDRLARLFERAGRTDEAIDYYLIALRAAPDDQLDDGLGPAVAAVRLLIAASSWDAAFGFAREALGRRRLASGSAAGPLRELIELADQARAGLPPALHDATHSAHSHGTMLMGYLTGPSLSVGDRLDLSGEGAAPQERVVRAIEPLRSPWDPPPYPPQVGVLIDALPPDYPQKPTVRVRR